MTVPDNNYVHNQGDMLVFPGGGGAAQILPAGLVGQVPVANPAASNGLGIQYQDNVSNVRGSFTLASGTYASIPVSQIAANSTIVFTVASLGTVTAPSSFLATITAGVGFVPVASQNTDTSVVNWALV